MIESAENLTLCVHDDHRLVCDTYKTLIIILEGYFPIIENLLYDIMTYPNFLIACTTLCFIFYESCLLIKYIIRL